jgi:hypothetical protein
VPYDDLPGRSLTARLVALSFDATQPDELARFWAHALRWDAEETAAGIDLVPTDATSFRIHVRPGAQDKAAPNRIHLDLTTASIEDQNDTVTELLRMGARRIDIGPGHSHVVLADPEGNELCVIEPFNRFLASCPRLGAVNCDGTRALGRFYSEALGWPLVWDQDEETAIQSPDGTGPKITWSGPPLMPKPPRDRLHLHIGPRPGATMQEALAHLITLGATEVDRSQTCRGAVGLTDVDGNEVCLVDTERAPHV